MSKLSRSRRSPRRAWGPGRMTSILATAASILVASGWLDIGVTEARAATTAIDPARPLATYPGFRMLPDGRSTVWLYLDRPVTATSRMEGNRYIIAMPRVQVGVRNNTNPLVTSHFPTPLARAWLRSTKDGAELVLELKRPLELKHRLERGPRGIAIISVVLPALDAGNDEG